jgi:hypothetical protein
MAKIVDRLLGWLLVIGALLHGFGSLQAYAALTSIQVWALSGSLAALLLAAINLMRIGRPQDRTLALVSLAGCVGWFAVAVGFGASIGNVLDPRALYHEAVALGLAAMSLRTIVRQAGE